MPENTNKLQNNLTIRNQIIQNPNLKLGTNTISYQAKKFQTATTTYRSPQAIPEERLSRLGFRQKTLGRGIPILCERSSHRPLVKC